MEKIFNIMLLIGVLYILYLGIQKYKLGCESKEELNKLDKVQIVNKSKDFGKTQIVNEPYQAKLDKLGSLAMPKNEPGEKIKFNYMNNKQIKDSLENKREFESQLSTWYPNTWIERINENGEPVYNSRENVTGIKEDFIESKARFTYEFNSPRSVQMDGIIDPDDFKNSSGMTLKEIYDNSFVDYKKMVPKKKMIEIDSTKLNTQNAGSFIIVDDKFNFSSFAREGSYSKKSLDFSEYLAEEKVLTFSSGSNLSFISPDTWIYEQEKPENGGKFENGLMADDPLASNSISNSLAIIDY
jgi:hypothetical protein